MCQIHDYCVLLPLKKTHDMETKPLTKLGHATDYPRDYAPEVLETFENRHTDHDYWVQFNCPEFTALCPITGQPDFAEIVI